MFWCFGVFAVEGFYKSALKGLMMVLLRGSLQGPIRVPLMVSTIVP